MSKKKLTAQEIRQQITNQMVEALKKDTVPWRRPWSSSINCGLAANFFSKRRYTGINTLILMFASMAKGYKSKFWGTAAAWKKHCGAYVKKGETATSVTLFNMIAKKVNGKPQKNAAGKDILFPLLRFFPVFNVEQLNLSKPEIAEAVAKYLVQEGETRNNEPNYGPAEELIKATGAKIEEDGDRAAYVIGEDRIIVPNRRRFDTMADYYETVLHELGHWTEKDDRVGKKEDHKYAWGELVAEMAACFLMTELQVPMAEKILANSQSYVANWLEGMAGDTKFIFDAASQASKVADYLLAFVGKQNPEYVEPDTRPRREIERAA